MIFYLIPPTAETPARLEPTQDAARAACRAIGTKFMANAMQHDVPTDKTGLLNYVNDLLAATTQLIISPPSPADVDPAPAISQVEVDAMFTPGPQRGERPSGWGANPVHSAAATDQRLGLPTDLGERVDAICDTIDALGAHHLGNVAHAVASRFGEIAKQAKAVAP